MIENAHSDSSENADASVVAGDSPEHGNEESVVEE